MLVTRPLIALLGVPAALFAQQHSTQLNLPTPAPVATAVRAVPGAPLVDGRLDDPVWQTAIPITDFTQRDPHEGQPATERTAARVAYTDDALYLAIRAHDS